jgi:hypothetical protein
MNMNGQQKMKATSKPDLGVDIPETFEFMTQRWTIEPGSSRDIGNDLGQCNRDELCIYLAPNYPTDVIVQTLFHELVHCWEVVLNMHLTEDQVDNLSVAMLHFFRTNPEFITLLVDREELEEEE